MYKNVELAPCEARDDLWWEEREAVCLCLCGFFSFPPALSTIIHALLQLGGHVSVSNVTLLLLSFLILSLFPSGVTCVYVLPAHRSIRPGQATPEGLLKRRPRTSPTTGPAPFSLRQKLQCLTSTFLNPLGVGFETRVVLGTFLKGHSAKGKRRGKKDKRGGREKRLQQTKRKKNNTKFEVFPGQRWLQSTRDGAETKHLTRRKVS
jgi:hypothetical protein